MRPFAFFQPDVRKNLMVPDFVDEVGEAVALRIQIGRVDLVNVSGKDNFGILTGARNNSFDFMRRQVLRLIDDKAHILDTPAANIRKRRDGQLLLLDGFCNLLEFLVSFAELAFDEFQIVPERFHIWIDFGSNIAG